jgi:DNA-binding response OmpR family regulator
MLRLAVVTPNPLAADAIELLAHESGAFQICYKASPVPPAKEVIRAFSVQNPAIVLLDLGDWDEAARIAKEIQHNQPRTVLIGFRPRWNRADQLTFEDAGILDLLHEPFSPGDIDAGIYEAMHRRYPVTHQNILAFAPAKAAQRSLAEAMARHLWPAGIHVALIIIDGVIGLERTRRAMPDKPDEFFLKPEDIAETAYWLTTQNRSAWSFEVEARPFGEKW